MYCETSEFKYCLTSLSFGGSCEFLCSLWVCTVTQQERLPSGLAPLSARPAALYGVFSLTGFPSLSVCGIVQTNQSHPSARAQQHPQPPGTAKPASHLLAWFACPAVAPLCGPTWCVKPFSLRWVSVTNKLLPVSCISVRHQCSVTLESSEQEISPSPSRWIEGYQNK